MPLRSLKLKFILTDIIFISSPFNTDVKKTDDDIEDLQRLTRQLRQDINELDVEKVDYIRAKERIKQ